MWYKIFSFFNHCNHFSFKGFDSKVYTVVAEKVRICLSKSGAHNRKGKRQKPPNQYKLCGENEEKMISFLTSSNQVERCCKGQLSSFGLSVFYFPQNAELLQVNMIFVTGVCDMCLLLRQFPLWFD